MRRKDVFEPGDTNQVVGTNTWSNETRQLIQQWIAQCVTEHIQCNRTTAQYDWLPTRLLDIQARAGSDADVYLIESKDITSKAQYVSLSHCWGRAPILSLRNENTEIFKKGVPVDRLPKTFQQAVEVARHLHIGYIWIDSLCIIQDSIADWQVESLTMKNVYQNAFCNIAATGSHNSRGGLFFERDPSLVSVSMVNLQWGETLSHGEHCLYPDTFWIDGVVSAPLNRRAWVVQERLLARRNIHFGSQSLFFECCEHEACETFPRGLPQGFHDNNRVNKFKHIYTKEEGLPNSPIMNSELWERVVSAFMRSDLTHASDKAVSLSGIAEEFQQMIFKDRYTAGLWESTLERQLLWLVVGERQANGAPSKRPPLYRAPSWSWLSIDANIHTGVLPYKPTLIDIKHVDIKLLDGNHPTGPITGGHMVISCYLLPATHAIRNSSDPDTSRDYLLFDGLEIGTTQIFFDETDKKPAKDELIFCLPISGSLDSHRWSGLVLSPTANNEAEYQRTGVFKASDKKFSDFCAMENACSKTTLKIV